MCRTIKILISNWPQKLKFSQFLQAGKTCQLLLTFVTKVTRWSRSTSNFYALIGQNLTGEFMRIIYAASWNLFTLTAEADRVLCQLVMFLTVFFLWRYKMKYSCYQESSVIHGWFVYWVLVEKCVACQNSVIRFRRASFSFFTLLLCVRGTGWNKAFPYFGNLAEIWWFKFPSHFRRAETRKSKMRSRFAFPQRLRWLKCTRPYQSRFRRQFSAEIW